MMLAKIENKAVNLGQALRDRAAENSDSIALSFEGETTSFAQLRDEVFGISIYLKKLGIKAGNRVACLSLNHPHMVRLVFACAEIGAMFAPFNSRLALAEYRYLIEDCEPAMLFHDDHFAEIATTLNKDGCKILPLAALDKLSGEYDFSHFDTPDQPLLLVYTSGTTGRPKGVLLTREAVWANIENGQLLYNFAVDQRILITLPLFHVGGLCILLLPALAHGATIELHRRFEPQATLAAMEKNVTSTILVPAQMSAIMALPAWEESTFALLKYLVVGSSIIPLDQIQAWHEKSVPVSQIYGATETGPSAIGLALEDCFEHEGSAGTPMPLCEIQVRDDARNLLSNNEVGDIWVRGPNVMSGYWRKPDETAEVLIDGWYNTGDVGKRDDDGFYWIVDRSKDVIISGGENIYPAEVEAASLEHSSIAAIAVVGKPHPKWGETPVAVVELVEGEKLDEVAYLSFLQDRIARYKQPKTLMILHALPRNVMGKIEKNVLREMVGTSAKQERE